jgi:hypothetical protein
MQITVNQEVIPEDTMFFMNLCYDEPGFDYEIPFKLLSQIPCRQIHINGSHVYVFEDDVFRKFAEHYRDNR